MKNFVISCLIWVGNTKMLTKLIKANYRKDFSQMVSFLAIVILAATMLNIGLTILFGFSSDMDSKFKAMNAAEICLGFDCEADDLNVVLSNIERYLDSNENVIGHVRVDGVYLSGEQEVETDENGRETSVKESLSGVYTPYEERDIDRLVFVSKSDEEFENPIYISTYSSRTVFKNHYKVGDEIELHFGDRTEVFQLAGIFESSITYDLIYVTSAEYHRISDFGLNYYEYLIDVEEGSDLNAISGEMSADLSRINPGVRIWIQDLDEMRDTDMIMVNLISAILCAFSLLVAGVVLIIVFFRISNSIELNIANIGALKALGCTSSQIRWAQVLEFAITSVVGTVISAIAAWLLLPAFAELLDPMTTVTWDAHIVPWTVIAMIVFFVLITVMIALISTVKIKDLDPVVALRFGLKSHSFKKNYLPLQSSKGPLVGVMALKSSMQGMRQNILTTVIMAAVGFVTAFVVFFGYNVCYKPVNLYSMISATRSDMLLVIDDPDALNDVNQLNHVVTSYYYHSANAVFDSKSIELLITDDWNSVPYVNYTEGRAPLYDDEIIFSSTMAEQNGIMVGDYVKLGNAGVEKEFMVCGLVQGTDNYGKFAMVNTDVASSLGFNFNNGVIRVVIEDSSVANVNKVLDEAESVFGDKLRLYFNVPDGLTEDPIIVGSTIICIIVVVVTVFVILLTMSLLIKTVIIRRQQEFGIKKALGFTSSQLRSELTLSMVPCVLIGSGIGAIIGIGKCNWFLSALLKSMGLAQSKLPAFPWMGILAVIFITLVSSLIVWSLSSRIKKISAYLLIKE